MEKEESFGVIPVRKKRGKYEVFLVKLVNGGHWGFPKGHRENELESPKEIAKRELKEETNLEIKRFISDISFNETYQLLRDNKKIEKIVIYFLIEVSGNFNLQKNEILDGGWFDINEAIEKITFSGSQNICKKVSIYLQKDGI